MKKFILLFLFVISVSFLFSQSGSFQLNFNGKLQSNGTPVTLQKVNVINLTRGVDTMINIAPFSFQLDYSVYVGINEPAKENKDNFIVHPVIPNPFNNNAEFDIEINESSNLQISLYSAGGKKLAGIERKCGTGINHFTINSSENGLLFLQVSDGKNSRSQKLINIYNSAKKSTEIVCNNSETEKKNHKSAKSTNPFIFFLGDQLQFIGYSSGYANSTIYDSPAADSTYTFEFTNLYYRIIGHKTETSMPCFVDVMFSVEDQYFKGVDNLDNTNFKVSEDGIVVSPSETFRYIMKMNTIPYKLKTVLMLDNSASVANNLNQIKAAAIALVNTISPKQEFAIYCFSDQPVLLQDFTDDVSLLTSKINSITTGYATTNLYGSYIQGVQKWDELFSLNGIEQGFLVVFTDGDDTQASSTLQQAVSARGTKKVYMIGLGQDIDPAHLNSLANPGPYYPVTNISELEQVFQEIQADILQYSNSFYWLNYMTPKRTGLHNLKLEIIGNQNTGTDSYYNSQFNANGFASVFSGVYLNMTPLQLYGIDSVEINNPAPFDLTAVTYWAYQPPSYSWSSSNDNIVTVNPDSLYFNRAQLNFPGIDGGVAYITVTDDANIYSKTLKVIAYISPVVSTSPISDTSFTTATGGGNVTGDGGMLVTERGVCWSNSPNPTTSNSHTSDGTGTGSFISSITGLNTNTTYYVKAYATNSIGTTYGAQMSFTTLATVAPTVTTDAITNITSISATSGGNVTSNGGLTVTARGVCWSTSQNPTTINSHTSNGTGTGSFISNITGLTIGATYYVRAYATNTIGTSYGSEVSFTTVALPTVTTTVASSITSTTAASGGNVSSDGGGIINARGVCWSTSQNPTTANSFTSDGTGTGNFTSSITGLMAVTTYYVKAYATNIAGTSYGNQISFISSSAILPTITTTSASNITPTSAISGGDISSNGGANITARGVCWSTSQNPTTSNSLTSNGTGSGNFTSNITGLTIGTTYYVKAYAANTVGTSYGSQVSFTTISLPTVTTTSASIITSTSGTSGGNITSDGGATITTRGVCWSTSQNPTTANSFTSDGTGAGNFTSSITGLTGSTTYYVKAYATNIAGTSYGSQVNFLTNPPVSPTVTTTTTSSLTYNTAISGGNVISDGGATITMRGVCWSTGQNPTTANSFTSDGTGTGSFVSSITGLTGSTTYYVRAYATNSAGTSYGNQVNFTTNPPILPTVTTTSVSSITYNSATSGGNVTSDGGATVTVRGVCWSTSQNPLTTGAHTSEGTGAGSFTSSLTGLAVGSTYYVRAYATNITGTSYGNQVNFTIGVGVSYQGGIIAYILQSGDPGYIAGQTHGLIAAPSDQGYTEWGCDGTPITGADGTALGTGNQNTIDIMAGCSTAGIAARLCGDLVLGGYSDWYLPSHDELYKLYYNKAAIGGFASNYWSSTEGSSGTAWLLNINDGGQGYLNKFLSSGVRAIRSF